MHAEHLAQLADHRLSRRELRMIVDRECGDILLGILARFEHRHVTHGRHAARVDESTQMLPLRVVRAIAIVDVGRPTRGEGDRARCNSGCHVVVQ